MDSDAMIQTLKDHVERLRAVDATGLVDGRLQLALQTACQFVDSYRDWHYTYRTWPVAVAANTQPLMPAADSATPFKNFGIAGGVFLYLDPAGNRKKPLHYKPMWSYYRIRSAARRGIPEFYSPGEGVSNSGQRYIFLEPVPAVDSMIDVVGKRAFPQLFGDQEPNRLKEIPEYWHELVVLQWAAVYLMRDKANAQAQTIQKALAEMGLKQMVREERHGREAIHHLAPFGAGIMYPVR